ncbi:MAG TPA: hypothetical protein VK501_15990 [Baekduia sp.]|uniref:hypothetical protein n=1 Tax=Baekduia sp. TaxID=2600305 RepID=UPI002BC497FE|nr:hypothetical protein [Baekduia sp.]HMJ35410.1 hypothetical protein [Baekduia sp.]
MTELELVRSDALRGVVVGISVSDSADLSRLGLAQQHCELAVAELARAVFIAGGTIVYGGRLIPSGFTDILIDEVRRYREDRDALVLCVPASEHRRLSDDELARCESELHTSAELVCLDANGNMINIHNRPKEAEPGDPAADLTAMRRHITDRCGARVLVGGRLQGHQGSMPGVLEEAMMSVKASQPMYVAGGFGGAAAAVASALGHEDGSWFPPHYPEHADDHGGALSELGRLAREVTPPHDGLSGAERRQLVASHRPGEISSLTVKGLAHRG